MTELFTCFLESRLCLVGLVRYWCLSLAMDYILWIIMWTCSAEVFQAVVLACTFWCCFSRFGSLELAPCYFLDIGFLFSLALSKLFIFFLCSDMKIHFIGNECGYNGKRLMYILGRLKNYGVGRMVYRVNFHEKYPEPTFFKITSVRPDLENLALEVSVKKVHYCSYVSLVQLFSLFSF